MKIKSTKILALMGAAVMLAGSLAGCGNGAETGAPTAEAEVPAAETEAAADENAEAVESTEENEGETTNTDLSGTITMAGSTSMEKLANAVAESFMAKYPGVTVSAEFTGSSAGIESLNAGSVDIGNSSRALTDDEKASGAVENIVAIDGIAVVANPSTTVDGLTTEELVGIYKGEIKNWSEVGGEDAAIVVVGREAGSGTRGAFEEILDIEDACAYANELDSTGAVMAKVAATPGAIGYVSLDVLDDTVKALKLNDVEPTAENITGGTYVLNRPFVMATAGEISEQSETVQALFEYLQSDEGKELIKSVGLITAE